MTPSVLSRQIRQAIKEYLLTSYPISTSHFANTLKEFLDREEAFKGPYVSFHLPFKEGKKEGEHYFPELSIPFAPYRHQEQAFQRLTGDKPAPTLVATGTGSGKTESFLYPILDHCRANLSHPGVKAILIYPMNALANDQARRVAQLVYESPSLRGKVRAGLYIGARGLTLTKKMTRRNVITDRRTMQKDPPDILMTNYKMLDYLMVRPRDAQIWHRNNANTLQYLVVDEIHTFDGAQGTDLACLVKRLKDRLDSENFCPVGTSATLGDMDDDSEELRKYAETIFGVSFGKDSIIQESRLSSRDYIGDNPVDYYLHPKSDAVLDSIATSQYNTSHEYIAAHYKAWFGNDVTEQEVSDPRWRSELGHKLLHQQAFQNLLKRFKESTMPFDDLAVLLAKGPLSNLEKNPQPALESLLALVSHARDPQNPERPLINVRLQLLIRELKRMVVSVGKNPRMNWHDDLQSRDKDRSDEQASRHLPLVVCHNCGAAGWGGRIHAKGYQINDEPQEFYRAFFERSIELCLLYPISGEENPIQKKDAFNHLLCKDCLVIQPEGLGKECRKCALKSPMIPVRVPDLVEKKDGRLESQHLCIYCHSVNRLGILGSQVASLTSVAIGQLFGSPYNDDRKSLVFSDSVQDASHRAGYFQARTYSFIVRGAILNHIQEHPDHASLLSLADGFASAQKEKCNNDLSEFVGKFIAPSLCWLDAYKDLVNRRVKQVDSYLVRLVEKRLNWEVYLALGLHARLGRSLENTMSVAVYPDPEKVDQAVNQLLKRLPHQFGELQDLTPKRLRQFLIGLIYRIRTSGGIDHEVLKPFIKNLGNSRFVMGERHIRYMPRLSQHSPLPAFVTNKKSKHFLPLGAPGKAARTWLRNWASKSLFSDAEIPMLVIEVYTQVLKALVEAGLMREVQSPDAPITFPPTQVWGLLPDTLRVTTKPTSFVCGQCRYRVCVPDHSGDTKIWDGMPCIRFTCNGRFMEGSVSETDFYRSLFQLSKPRRIEAKEHSGLLDRLDRERLEKNFMRTDQKPWDPNILSCTPTLELGVDIGQLSSVILANMPPTGANYVQRIGRAGRRDGNALAITMAAGQPHDLFYFANPDRMINGSVEAPGTFLRAPAVLKRQLAAFTLDQWVKNAASKDDVPKRFREVLKNLSPKDKTNFPYNWLEYVKKHASPLSSNFIDLFKENITEDTRKVLKSYLESSSSGSLISVVENAFFSKQREIKKLSSNIGAIGRKIKKLRSEPDDEYTRNKIKDLNRVKQGLSRARTSKRKKDIFGFLCDEGILPNYAFPQSATTLQSVVLHNEGDGKTKLPPEEYSRPTAIALRDFAPGSTFYAGSRHVLIDKIDLGPSHLEEWRFCETCSYCEPDISEPQFRCPKCSSHLWGGVGNKYKMIRLNKVESISDDRKSRTHDDTEERKRAYWLVRTHVLFDQNQPTSSMGIIKDLETPFGFEFIPKTTFRMVNFGRRKMEVSPVLIAGEEQKTEPFECCPTCGKVNTRRKVFKHEYACKHWTLDSEKVSDLAEKTFLYHEFESESIRMLLPIVSDLEDFKAVESFSAALNLGLQKYFGGRVGHLGIIAQSDPIPGESLRKTFLFLYDSVPGGTGYLKDLLDKPKNLFEVLQIALNNLKSCDCGGDKHKDGCYQCLFAYRNRFVRDRVSRSLAISIIEEILKLEDKLEEIKSLNNIRIDTLLESECERKFVQKLREKFVGRFETVQQSGGTEIYIITDGEKPIWYVDCQVRLNKRHGVEISSQPDFLFRPAGPTKSKPIAVFTDGFKYHRDIQRHDTAKRMAIMCSGNYLVWSLSWNDLVSTGDNYFMDFLPLQPGKLPKAHLFEWFLSKTASLSNGKLAKAKQLASSPSLPMFFRLLMDPDNRKWKMLAYCSAMALISDQWKPNWTGLVPHWFGSHTKGNISGNYHVESEGIKWGTVLACIEKKHVQNMKKGSIKNIDNLQVAVHLNDSFQSHDSFKRAWNGFLKVMNLLQFLPKSGFFCQTGIEANSYEDLEEVWTGESGWQEFFNELDPSDEIDSRLEELLHPLSKKNFLPPVLGLDLSDDQGRVGITSLAAWPDLRMAIVYDGDQMTGWTCYPLNEVSAETILKF